MIVHRYIYSHMFTHTYGHSCNNIRGGYSLIGGGFQSVIVCSTYEPEGGDGTTHVLLLTEGLISRLFDLNHFI